MGKTHESISSELAAFFEAQPLFFVATAPHSGSGHINISPKGLDTFRILSPKRIAYLDLTGSGNETAAHVTENSRLTLMFCSFAKDPKIVRLYGRGRVILPADELWPELIARFPAQIGIRQIILADIEFVQISCGFGVPMMELVNDRDLMAKWAEGKGPEGLRDYRRAKNRCSIDGLPAPSPDEPSE
jgi:hypothetical protein